MCVKKATVLIQVIRDETCARVAPEVGLEWRGSYEKYPDWIVARSPRGWENRAVPQQGRAERVLARLSSEGHGPGNVTSSLLGNEGFGSIGSLVENR